MIENDNYIQVCTDTYSGSKHYLVDENIAVKTDIKYTQGANNNFVISREFDSLLRQEQLPGQLDFCYKYFDVEFAVFSSYTDTVNNYIWIKNHNNSIEKIELPTNYHYLNNIRIEDNLYMISYPNLDDNKKTLSLPVTIFDLKNYNYTHYNYKLDVFEYLQKNNEYACDIWNNITYLWLTMNTVTTNGDCIYLSLPTPTRDSNDNFRMYTWFISFKLDNKDNILDISLLNGEGIGITIRDDSAILMTSNDGGRELSNVIYIDLSTKDVEYERIDITKNKSVFYAFEFYDNHLYFTVYDEKEDVSKICKYSVYNKTVSYLYGEIKGVVETIRICKYEDDTIYNL